MVDTIVGGLRDCIFFLVVAFLGFHHLIGEPILAALLSAYTAHRFGVSMGKQQAVIALNNGPGPNGSGGSGTGTSGTMPATPDPQTSPTRRIDQRTLKTAAEPPPTPPDLSLDTGAYQVVAGTLGGIG